MNIGIDIDGILADFFKQMIPIINKLLNTNYKFEQLTKSRFETSFNIKRNIWNELNLRKILLDTPPLPDAVKYFQLLKRKHNIYIVTARNSGQKQVTLEWLKKHNLIYNDIIFSPTKNNLPFCNNHFDVFIEDNPKFILTRSLKDRYVLYFSYPYNQNIKPTHNIKKMPNWQYVYNFINSI